MITIKDQVSLLKEFLSIVSKNIDAEDERGYPVSSSREIRELKKIKKQIKLWILDIKEKDNT